MANKKTKLIHFSKVGILSLRDLGGGGGGGGIHVHGLRDSSFLKSSPKLIGEKDIMPIINSVTYNLRTAYL